MSNRKPQSGAGGTAFVLSLVAGILFGGASVLQAAPQNGLTPTETLSQLIALNGPMGGVQIGNLIFNNFAYSGSPSPNPAPDAAHISVSNSSFSGTGLDFSAGWGAFGGGSPQESKISFTVQALTGFVITQAELDFNGATPAPATGTAASTTDSIYNVDANLNPVGSPLQLTVFNNVANGPATNNQSTLGLSTAQPAVFVQKDILLTASASGYSSISLDDSTFKVAAGSVPEPASITLMGVMGLGLLARRRRA